MKRTSHSKPMDVINAEDDLRIYRPLVAARIATPEQRRRYTEAMRIIEQYERRTSSSEPLTATGPQRTTAFTKAPFPIAPVYGSDGSYYIRVGATLLLIALVILVGSAIFG